MGQKTHPYGFRVGYNKPWKSRWDAGKEYADLLHEDVALRKQLKDKLRSAGVSSIDIERAANKLVDPDLYRSAWIDHWTQGSGD